jgi:hypothetical protein
MKWYYEVVVSSLGESVIFSLGCALAGLAGAIVFKVPFSDVFGLVLLVVGAGLMLLGGAMSFVTPGNVKFVNIIASALTRTAKPRVNPGPEDYRRTQHSAALYSLTGILLFSYSLILGLVLG